MKLSGRYLFPVLVATWSLLSWFGASHYANHKTESIITTSHDALESDSLALYQAFEERLNYLTALPGLVAREPDVIRAVQRYSHSQTTRTAGNDLKTYWTKQPDLSALNHQLETLAAELGVDVIFVLNAEGYSIAASNSETPGSIVGTKLTDRHYYQAAIQGNKAHQYAVGRKTNVPGLYYSAPIMLDGKQHGVMVVKLDIVNFQSLLAPYHAYLTDSNDVIVLSSDPNYLQHILPNARFLDLDNDTRQLQYKRTEFSVLPSQPWFENDNSPLIRLGTLAYPVITTDRQIPGGDLVSHLFQGVPEIPVIQQERYVFAIVTALAGLAVLFMLRQLIIYLQNLRLSKTHAEAISVQLSETLSDRENELKRLAFVDTLTLLPNRNALLQHLASLLPEAASAGRYGALFLVNMDSLKLINDRLGHIAGDHILSELAARLSGNASKNSYVARLAGDEFIIIFLTTAESQEAATRAASAYGQDMLHRITAPYLIKNHTLHMTASVGVTLFGPALTVQSDALLAEVDAAMYEAKQSHRGGIHFFDDQVRQTLEKRAEIANRLLNAVRTNQFVQIYQPQIDNSGHVAGVEALIRWHDEALGHVPPTTFIPLAETLHIIADIDRWVLVQACKTAGQWRNDPVLSEVPISINVSGEFFSMKGFVDEIATAVAAHNAQPAQLMIELTEGTLILDSEQNQKNITELHQRGFKVAIDDFGTGNSSLSYMHQFNVDQLKIDQSFVRDMLRDERSLAIVEFIINLASSLSYTTLAEGVETVDQHLKLKAIGCNLYQGFLFSKPLAKTECESFIRKLID